ncbi:enoyl-CoA hydratase/isomerase [Xylariomycetidae sp. FL2044]|nr:enoyl-CoA hydratase/isomerase [Xylariomycetidae sp. FL2044]
MSFRLFACRAGPAARAASSCRSASFTMPLRAKILDPRATQRAQMHAGIDKDPVTETIKELPGDEPEDVLFGNLYGLRTIELNRPYKLNALNASMIRKIFPRLVEWEKSDMANVVVMKGAGDKAFCAGGDVATLALQNKEGPEGQKSPTTTLRWSTSWIIISPLTRHHIAFMDGITMGGGVGLSIHAPFRIATERTMFAMPETTIGFFPDVGASFFLPRLAGSVGTYLALTSERLRGANVFYSGIATHYLHSTSLPNLESRTLAVIEMTIEEYATGLPPQEPILIRGELRKAIDRCFSKNTISEIIAALGREDGPTRAWAEKTIETLHQRSPTSVNVALKQMRKHQIASKFMKHPDFVEGVSVQVISKEKPKPKPKWQPATLEDVEPGTDIAEPFFKVTPDPPKLKVVTDRDYFDYPYTSFGVPSERDIELAVLGGKKTPHEIVQHFVNLKKGRQGIKKIVEEVVSRKTALDSDGKATWVYEKE